MPLNLGNLIAKQKGQPVESKPHETAPVREAEQGSQSAGVDQASAAEPLEAHDSPAQPAAATPTKFKFGGAKPAGGGSAVPARVDSNPVPDRPAVDSRSDGPATRPAATGVAASRGSAELDALFDTEELGNVPAGRDSETAVMVMPDLVDVQCPVRDLPDEISMETQAFVEQLNQIYDIVHDPELFGQFIRTIMQELQEHPEYIKVMAPSDSHVMIAGLRQSMGLAQIKKESKARKPSSTTTKAGTKRSTKAGEFDAILDGMEGMDFS